MQIQKKTPLRFIQQYVMRKLTCFVKSLNIQNMSAVHLLLTNHNKVTSISQIITNANLIS